MHDATLNIQLSGELSALRKLGIDESKLGDYKVLCLPENVFTTQRVEELHEGGDALYLAKSLRAAGISCATAYDFGLDVQSLERRSKDRWLGTVWIRDIVAVPFVVGILSGLVVNKISEEQPKPKVHVDMYIERGPNITKMSYSGDGDSLVKMLQALNAEK